MGPRLSHLVHRGIHRPGALVAGRLLQLILLIFLARGALLICPRFPFAWVERACVARVAKASREQTHRRDLGDMTAAQVWAIERLPLDRFPFSSTLKR